jgi:hypothetical protein
VAGPIMSAMAGMLAALLSVVMIARPRVEMQISKMLQSAPESPNRPLLTTFAKADILAFLLAVSPPRRRRRDVLDRVRARFPKN